MLQNPAELRKKILIEPVLNGADTLRIISGYAAHTMVSWHISELWEHYGRKAVNIDLIVGMCCRDKLFRPVHEGFKDIMQNGCGESSSKLACKYIIKGSPVHSKIYLWEKEGEPLCAYTGSANYTQPAFFGRHRESMTECDPSDTAEYLDSLEEDSMFCNHSEIEEKIIITDKPQNLITPESEDIKLSPESVRGLGIQEVRLSFLNRNGEVSGRSGVNWGQRDNREPNQAYLHVPSGIAKSDFFPDIGVHFTVLTDDGRTFILSRGQQGGKGISTPLNNSLLGEYLRFRLGLPNGAFITRTDFENYGRTDITFYKIDDEQYFMDFSKPEGV